MSPFLRPSPSLTFPPLPDLSLRFTRQQYHRMQGAGIFAVGDRLELIQGEICKMSPIGAKHATCVAKLSEILTLNLSQQALIWVQNPIILNDRSEPQPDLALLRRREDFYAQGLPTPGDIYLIIEVVDSSIEYDRQIKIPLYAQAGIPEAWLIDVNAAMVSQYSQPARSGYKCIRSYEADDPLPMLTFPHVTLNLQAFLPGFSEPDPR